MKVIVLVGFCIATVLAASPPIVYEDGVEAEVCKADVCTGDSACRCGSSKGPLALEDTPQLISLTFDEAVTDDLYNNYWYDMLFTRENPDGKPIGATFFVPHEYTDYQKVNDLYNSGFEIGVHSITKNNLQKYWRTASEELLEQEFGGQKIILNKFANIPEEDILGVRTPQLQLAANATIKAYVNSGLAYDSSWPTQPSKPLYPYTLDYLSAEECLLGSECPNEAFPGFWILPINDLNGIPKECNSLASCNITGSADVIANWLNDEVESIRNSTKVPLTLLVNSYWFDFTENSLEGFTKFLDGLTDHKDTFLVTQKQVLDWIKDPVSIADFQTEEPSRNANCNPYSCKFELENKTRYMNACIPCPQAYPWIGNPEGNAT